MKSSAKKIELASVDDLFSTEESRADAQRERVLEIPLSELHPFKNHPFKVKDDEAMLETADSIKQYGVLVPAIARPDPEGGYELVAGHRRHRASELAEKETMPVIVRDLDDDAATIIMVDSNLQRESLLPSERAFAYKGRLWRFFLHLRLLGLDGIFFCQFLFSLDFVILRLFLFGKIAAFLDKRGNALGNLFPVQVNIRAVLLFIVQSFPIVIFAAVCCAGQGMRASANAILVFEESHFLLIRMVCHEERIDTAFSSGETAAAGHSGVDLILGNEVLDGWHLGKL